MRVSLAAVLAACLVLIAPAVARAADVFRTPGDAVFCRATFNDLEWEWNTLLRSLTCVTPNDGFYLHMTGLYGKPLISKGYRTSFKGMGVDATEPVLRYGQRWDPFGIGVISCISRRSGLKCTHQSGHGWWLGRFRGYRIF